MNKHTLHHWFTRLRAIKSVYLLLLILIAASVFVISYRNNNITALQLRDKVLQVDKENGDVEAALRELREYTYGHMNANLSGGANTIYPPIQLKYRYERLVQAEKDRVATVNGAIYTQAQAYCEQQVTSRVTINRVPCIQEYLATHGGVQEKAIPDALYKFDFAAPSWSPDLAGWSLVATISLMFLFVAKSATQFWLKEYLKR